MRTARGCTASGPRNRRMWTSCSTQPPTRSPRRSKEFDMAPDTHVARRAARTLAELDESAAFQGRHIGPDASDEAAMLAALGFESREALIDAVVPRSIRRKSAMGIGAPKGE